MSGFYWQKDWAGDQWDKTGASFEKLLQVKVHPKPITGYPLISNRNSGSEWIVFRRDQWIARSSIWKGLRFIFMPASMTLREFTFCLHISNKLKKLQVKASTNHKIVKAVWREVQRQKGYPGTWQRGQAWQGQHFGHKAFPSALLTTWRFHSPSFALILYSILITKSSLFFWGGDVYVSKVLPSWSVTPIWLPSLLSFFPSGICACKNTLPERTHPGNWRKSCRIWGRHV